MLSLVQLGHRLKVLGFARSNRSLSMLDVSGILMGFSILCPVVFLVTQHVVLEAIPKVISGDSDAYFTFLSSRVLYYQAQRWPSIRNPLVSEKCSWPATLLKVVVHNGY